MPQPRADRAPAPERRRTLRQLTARAENCRICTFSAKPLPHEPRPVIVASATARILIAGQAPGTRVHETGVPFNDRSGDRLREWMGVTRGEFYDPDRFAILPMGFCFPGQDAKGGDLPPRRECTPAWRQAFMDAMPQIELVLAIGLHAQGWHLGHDRGENLAATVGNWREILARDVRPRVLPLPHPSWRNTAWLKKHPWFEIGLLPELRSMVRALL